MYIGLWFCSENFIPVKGIIRTFKGLVHVDNKSIQELVMASDILYITTVGSCDQCFFIRLSLLDSMLSPMQLGFRTMEVSTNYILHLRKGISTFRKTRQIVNVHVKFLLVVRSLYVLKHSHFSLELV